MEERVGAGRKGEVVAGGRLEFKEIQVPRPSIGTSS